MDFGPDIANQKAFIIEDECIGCKKCIDACPVDAIHGAPWIASTGQASMHFLQPIHSSSIMNAFWLAMSGPKSMSREISS